MAGCVNTLTFITVLTTYSGRRRRNVGALDGMIRIATGINGGDVFAHDGPINGARRTLSMFGSNSLVHVLAGNGAMGCAGDNSG